MGITGVLFLLLCIVLREARHGVILRRRAERLRKDTGNMDLDAPEEMPAQGPKQLMRVSLLRPFHFLYTEPVIMFCALNNGYLFGLKFLFNGAFTLVFGPMDYGFNTIEVGLANLGICVGVLFGSITHLWQERYYLKKIEESGGKNIPEARVQMSMVAAVGEVFLVNSVHSSC